MDPTDDPELEEILVVKKKSRAGLDGMAWGPLEEVTNVPSVDRKQILKVLKPHIERGCARMMKPNWFYSPLWT